MDLIITEFLYVNEAFNTSYSDGTSYSYRAKEDGSLYVNVWYTDSYNWYYYGEDGKHIPVFIQ